MGDSLFPTRTRRALLQDVADGLVVEADFAAWRDETLGAFYDPFTATRTKVTAQIRDLRRAGWVEFEPARSTYRLTDAGRTVLTSKRG